MFESRRKTQQALVPHALDKHPESMQSRRGNNEGNTGYMRSLVNHCEEVALDTDLGGRSE